MDARVNLSVVDSSKGVSKRRMIINVVIDTSYIYEAPIAIIEVPGFTSKEWDAFLMGEHTNIYSSIVAMTSKYGHSLDALELAKWYSFYLPSGVETYRLKWPTKPNRG
jgi:hypothetical protein